MIGLSPRPSLLAARHATALAALLAATLAAVPSLEAQQAQLAGTVVDRLTKRPAVGAEVVVLGTDRKALTDDAGWFAVPKLKPGRYTVEIRYLGLASSQFPVQLSDGTTLFDFEIVTPPFELDELIVEVRPSRHQKLEDFERRRERVAGYFISRETIEDEAPVFISDLLRRIPNVKIEWDWAQNVRVTMGHGLFACTPDLYIDGSLSHAARLNDYTPTLIEAIEVYNRPVDRPQEFRAHRCGAILLWTREQS